MQSAMTTPIRRPRAAYPTKRPSLQAVHTSIARLNKLQKITEQSVGTVLLCLQGIDSRYNEGMQEFVDFLFLKVLESHRNDLVSSGIEDESIDDLIVAVRSQSVDVYCNPVNYKLIMPFITTWPNTTVHCLNKEDYDNNEDFAEEFKIKCFVSMVSECKEILLPYFSTVHSSKVEFDKMKVEQWPIVQAYALEGYGSGTFFTLQHEVKDISEELKSVYSQMDSVRLEAFITECIPTFERQWECLVRNVDVASLGNFATPFTESQAAEPLLTYYSHGKVGDSKYRTDHTEPYVLFGVNTSNLNRIEKNVAVGSLDVLQSGINGQPALHMVCHEVDPKTGLACTRTYFFDSSALPADLGTEKVYHNPDVEQLSRVYRAAIEAVVKAINEFALSRNKLEVIENAKRNIENSLHKFIAFRRIHVDIELTDRRAGHPVAVTEETTPNGLLELSATITKIYSPEQQAVTLGGVAFSESFVISSLPCTSRGVEGCCKSLILTQNIPRWITWNISSEGQALYKSVDHRVNSAEDSPYGRLLINGQTADLFSPQQWLQPILCNLYIYDLAVVLQSSSLGPICIGKNDIKSASFYEGRGPNTPALLILYTSLDLQSKLPHQLSNSQRIVLICLNPRTKAYKQFQEQAFPTWKQHEEDVFQVKIEEALPDSVSQIYDAILSKFHSQLSGQSSAKPGQRTAVRACYLPGAQQFMEHLTVSSSLQPNQAVPPSDISVLLNQTISPAAEELTTAEDNSVLLLISIISGVPGSYKENVASYITQLTQERSRWVIHKQTPETSHEFDAGKLQNTLSYVYSMLKKKSNAGRKSSRMLVITPGYTDVKTVIEAIENHPAPELQQSIRIGSVTTCVDPHNTFLHGYTTVPGLLEQCAAGWTNNIILTSSGDHGNVSLALVQDMLRTVNPLASFILTDRGEITRSQDIELILSESAFKQPECVKLRLMSASKGFSSAAAYGMNTVILKYKQPLIKQKLISQLRGQSEKLNSGEKFGVILSVVGKTMFSEPLELMDFSYSSASNVVKAQAAQAKQGETTPDYFMSFTGFDVKEGNLKDLLRMCVPAKPERKLLLDVKDLSIMTRNKIHKERHLDPLPPGWFYNGSHYVDILGDKLERHPEFGKFLQEYVDKENAAIQAYNTNVDSLSKNYHDLFE